MSPFLFSLIVFACVFIGGMLGLFVGPRLPTQHASSDSKDVVRLGMGLVATTVALVLGLLVASAKSFYDTQNNEVTPACCEPRVARQCSGPLRTRSGRCASFSACYRSPFAGSLGASRRPSESRVRS